MSAHRSTSVLHPALLGTLLLAGCPPPPAAVCGNGLIEADELCDDANQGSGDGCGSTCRTELSWSCRGEPSSCISNLESQGLSACVNGRFDGETALGEGERCYTFRAVAGVSMGGGSAARIAAAYPELFDVVGVMGSPFADLAYFFHMVRHSHMSGFCDHDQILAAVDDLDDAEDSRGYCGPVQLDDNAIPDSECMIFPSGYNDWFRGPAVGRGGTFSRNGLIEIFHDLTYAYGNIFYQNPENPITPPGVPDAWRVPLGLQGSERAAARAEACRNPVVLQDFYNLEYNPDGSLPVITFCDGARGDTGSYWPDHHTLVSGPAGNRDGHFQSASLLPGESYQVSFPAPGSYLFHCAEHPRTETATRVHVEGEACDDGNRAPGDGCSSACLIEPGFTCSAGACTSSCGDGVVDPSETCDDGNRNPGDGCDPSCERDAGHSCHGAPSQCSASCGDGILDDGETCDDANPEGGDGCSPGCLVERGFRCQEAGPASCHPLCGDGVLDEDETCDDGNQTAGDGCTQGCAQEPGYSCSGQPSQCLSGMCGNGIIDPGEACDDGNQTADDGCGSTCKLDPGYTCAGQPSFCAASRCGNGVTNPGERCDDGDLESGDGCSAWCEVESGFKCGGSPSVCSASCGDGVLDPEDASHLCAGGNGPCQVGLAHLVGFGDPIRLRPQQPLRLGIVPTHEIPIEFALAVDYNRNGRRDYGEPLIDNSAERFHDVGPDGCASVDEDDTGGCGGDSYDPIANPDPGGDDYDYLHNPLGTENNFLYDAGEPYDDHGLDGVPATGDFGEGDGLFTRSTNLEAGLQLNARHRVLDMPAADFDRLDWWLDAGIRDFINSSQSTNQLFGALRHREPDTRVYDGEPTLPGHSSQTFWYLNVDYSPESIGKNAYLRYGDPAICPGVDEVFGSGNHVGPGNQILERLYTVLSFTTYRMPEGDFDYIDLDFDQLDGPTDQISDFMRLEHMFSSSLDREIDYGLVLPPDYYIHPEARYPVIYFMHGQGQSAADLVLSGIVFFTNQKESFLDSRVAEGRSDWQKKIIVFVDGECRSEDCYTGNFYVNFRGLPDGRQFEDALLELMRHVDDTYRTKRPKVIRP